MKNNVFKKKRTAAVKKLSTEQTAGISGGDSGVVQGHKSGIECIKQN